MKAKIHKIEYYLPERSEDNFLLKSENPDWIMEQIESKTGIYKRWISEENQSTGDLGFEAGEKLLSSETNRETIDCLIFVTQSPDYVLPTTACLLQDRLGLSKNCMAFDINMGCSGFVYALSVAASLIESQTVSKAIVICSETYTKYISKNDRTNRPIFSDGAAAILVCRSDKDQIGPFDLGSDGAGGQNLIVRNRGSRIESDSNLMSSNTLFMNGAEVFMFTMKMVPKSVISLLARSKKTIEEIDLFIFHQASNLVLSNIIRHLKLSEEKVFINLAEVGNTVSASIPIALKQAEIAGRLKPGALVMLVGFGVGYSWGSCLVRWGD